MLNSRLLFILIFSFFIINVVNAENSDVNGSECSRIEINETLVESAVLKGVAENLGSVVAGKLLYKKPSGYCVPTNETYLIGMLDGGYPKILSALNGHTPSAKMAKLGSEYFLLVFYFSGGNQYVLRPYKLVGELLKEVNGPVFSSNIRSIELVGDTILVKNQVYSNGEKAVVELESYRYHENQFVLAK